MKYNELEVELDSLDTENYRVRLRFTKGDSAQSIPQEVKPHDIDIDHTALRESLHDFNLPQYSRRLRDAIFVPPDIHALFVKVSAPCIFLKHQTLTLPCIYNDVNAPGGRFSTRTSNIKEII